MPAALVFGASGQIGRPLLARLREAGWDIVAVSRTPRREPGTCWVQGAFPDIGAVPGTFDVVFSCGPLDHFGAWYAAHGAGIPRVVAFGSTSVLVKHASADPAERDLAARLSEGEAAVFSGALRHGAAATVLRPTLVYGAGADRTLTRIADLARRWRLFPLPRDAIGLRQPVHVDDLAAAAVAAQASPAAHDRAYALPGGEALPYRDMVARVLSVLDPPARVLALPSPVFKSALAVAKMAGVARGFGDAATARLHEDLVFDASPARDDFGYAPRPFAPTAAMFEQPR
ncbi:MAG TPA: NAD-dependent epimerase/dehydratase family protein [Xanthomonadaceae bacterium]|nr:NAD-dependent epimerase/dehydratase family protein [Xanthomonadaceae bacterium]